MVRLLAIISVVASMMTLSVLANPTFPGICQVSGMAAPHGTTPAIDKKFTVSIKLKGKATKGNIYSVTIGGQGAFTGLLFYATDQATKARFGSFTNIPSAYSPLTSCKGENPKTNTLGHNTPMVKKLPVTFTWADGGHSPGKAWTGKFTGIVVSDLTTWYVIPPTSVTGGIVGGNATISSVLPGVSTVVPTQSRPPTDTSSPTSSSWDNTTSLNNTNTNTTIDPSASNATLTSSSAAHLSGSLVLCALLSAFALSASL